MYKELIITGITNLTKAKALKPTYPIKIKETAQNSNFTRSTSGTKTKESTVIGRTGWMIIIDCSFVSYITSVQATYLQAH